MKERRAQPTFLIPETAVRFRVWGLGFRPTFLIPETAVRFTRQNTFYSVYTVENTFYLGTSRTAYGTTHACMHACMHKYVLPKYTRIPPAPFSSLFLSLARSLSMCVRSWSCSRQPSRGALLSKSAPRFLHIYMHTI